MRLIETGGASARTLTPEPARAHKSPPSILKGYRPAGHKTVSQNEGQSMKRYCLSPIIGTGVFPTPYRAAVSDVSNTNTNSIIPTDQQGQPVYGFALSIVGTANLAGVLQVTNSYVFPDYPLDGEMGSMDSAARTALVQSVEAFDMDGNGLNIDASHQLSESYRTVLNRIGQQIEPAFNVNNFDAQEPAQ